MNIINTGIEELSKNNQLQKKIKGNIALLCHSASINQCYQHSVNIVKSIFPKQLIKIFGPQHGFVTDVQDNMIETDDFIHPYFKIPVYSLYGKTRTPTEKMLEEIDTFIIDLQDVGTRVYTYIHTMSHVLETCQKQDIKVVILDRPNPIGGNIIEGNMLDHNFKSFVGLHPIPMRHGLTIGEMALLINKYFLKNPCDLDVISMKNWKRDYFWDDTNLPWVNPSPNLPTWEGTLTFCGTVLFEGTNISEGRGTTRPLEIIGHPNIDAFSFSEHINSLLSNNKINGIISRPQVFLPTFQKFKGEVCQGIQLHITNKNIAKPWQVGQIICRELYHLLKENFKWNNQPYEYETTGLAIDYINGSDTIRKWAENNGSIEQLKELENIDQPTFLEQRNSVLIYE